MTLHHHLLAGPVTGFDHGTEQAGFVAFPHWYEHRSLLGLPSRAECETTLSRPEDGREMPATCREPASQMREAA